MQQRCRGAVVAAALLAAAAAMATHAVPAAAAASSSAANAAAGLDLVYGTYQQCEGQADALGCLKLQAIKVMHRALSQDSLPITEGLALVRAEGAGEAAGAGTSGAPMGDEEALARALPADAGRRQARLDELLTDHVTRLLRSRAISLSVPRLLAGLLPAVEEEGEGARKEGGGGGGGGGGKGGKKGQGALLLAMLMKGGMIAYAYKALAVLAGKALLVAKVALVLASVLGLSHLVGHGHKGGGTTYEIVKHPVVSHGYSHSQAVLPADDHHHFDVTAVGHGGGHGGGFGGSVGGGHGGGQLYGGHGWGRVGVGRSLGDLAAAASPAPASQLVAPEAADQAASVAETGGRSPEA